MSYNVLEKLLGQKPYQDITAEEVQRRLESGQRMQLIDVRTRGEFKSGHIPGAVHITLKNLERKSGEIARDLDIVVYCKSSLRRRRAASSLCKMGCERVSNMTGGLSAWCGPVK